MKKKSCAHTILYDKKKEPPLRLKKNCFTMNPSKRLTLTG